MRHLLVLPLLLFIFACAITPTATPGPHGKISSLSTVEGVPELCDHQVPEVVCTRHHPELEEQFKKAGDWCGEHGVPESQCLICHPDLTFGALPKLPPDADLSWLSKQGEDVEALARHAVSGKVTVFDFYADWCAPCRKIDEHLYTQLQTRKDLAVRKLNVVSWETPVAKRHLAKVPNLPYLVVYGRDGQLVAELSGFDLAKLDAAIAEGASR